MLTECLRTTAALTVQDQLQRSSRRGDVEPETRPFAITKILENIFICRSNFAEDDLVTMGMTHLVVDTQDVGVSLSNKFTVCRLENE
jgi:hypothetical protein